MRGNGQTESNTDDDRSSTGSYKGKSTKSGNKLHIAQHAVNQITMHQNVKLNTHYSVTFSTDMDMQQKCADTE